MSYRVDVGVTIGGKGEKWVVREETRTGVVESFFRMMAAVGETVVEREE